MSFMMLYLPGSLLGSWLINSFSFRTSILIATAVNLAGCAIRLASVFFANGVHTAPTSLGYILLLLGQCFCALSQPFMCNTAAKMAGEWFPAAEQNVATTIGSLINPLGNALGQVVPSIFVSCTVGMNAEGNCPRQHIEGFFRLLLVQAVMSVLVMIWTWTCFLSEPKYAPSEAALQRRELRESPSQLPHMETETPLQEMMSFFNELCKNKDFMILTLGFGIGLGLFNAFLTLIDQIIQPVFYTEMTNGTMPVTWRKDTTTAQNYSGLYGGALIITGLIGASIVGPILDKYHCYKTVLKVGLIGAVVMMTGFIFVLRPGDMYVWLMGVFLALMGMFMVPILPTALEVGVECTYPVPEEYSSGFLMSVGQLFGIVFSFTMPSLLQMEPNWYLMNSQITPFGIFTFSIIGAGGVFMFIFDGQYKKQAAEMLASAGSPEPVAV